MEPRTVEYADWIIVYGDMIDVCFIVGLLACIVYAIIEVAGVEDD